MSMSVRRLSGITPRLIPDYLSERPITPACPLVFPAGRSCAAGESRVRPATLFLPAPLPRRAGARLEPPRSAGRYRCSSGPRSTISTAADLPFDPLRRFLQDFLECLFRIPPITLQGMGVAIGTTENAIDQGRNRRRSRRCKRFLVLRDHSVTASMTIGRRQRPVATPLRELCSATSQHRFDYAGKTFSFRSAAATQIPPTSRKNISTTASRRPPRRRGTISTSRCIPQIRKSVRQAAAICWQRWSPRSPARCASQPTCRPDRADR